MRNPSAVAAERRYHEKNREKKAAANRRRVDEHQEFLAGWKASRGCVHCGENDPDCLDLHHRDPSQKTLAFASAGTRARHLVIAELEKCDVLCANCHRKLHAQERRARQGQ
jgi:hypothetical protein